MRWLAAALLIMPGSGLALTADDLADQGYRMVECLFIERCLIGAPCERAWRDQRWHLNDATGTVYREGRDGRLRRGLLFLDRRWEERSDARQIVMPMEEAVASHLTIFDGGDAIYSLQYWASPGSGQFLRGTCDSPESEN